MERAKVFQLRRNYQPPLPLYTILPLIARNQYETNRDKKGEGGNFSPPALSPPPPPTP